MTSSGHVNSCPLNESTGNSSHLADISSSTNEDPGFGTTRRKRTRSSFKHHQLRTMKSYFGLNHNPDAKDLKDISQKTGLLTRVIQVKLDTLAINARLSHASFDVFHVSLLFLLIVIFSSFKLFSCNFVNFSPY